MLFNLISSPICSSPTRKGVREPLAHKIKDRKISRDNPTRNHEITTAYSSFCFTLSLLANSETNLEHSSPIPPLVPKTSGVKLSCSTSRTLSLYSSCFFSLFVLSKYRLCVLVLIGRRVNMCNSYIKKCCLSTPPAFTSKRAPSSEFAVRYWNLSFMTGNKLTPFPIVSFNFFAQNVFTRLCKSFFI